MFRWNLLATHKGGIMPAQLPCCQGRKGSVEVGCDAKDGASHVLLIDIIEFDHAHEEFASGGYYCVCRILLYGGSTSDASTAFRHWVPPCPLMGNKKAWGCMLHASGNLLSVLLVRFSHWRREADHD